jgi:hypothetical protein
MRAADHFLHLATDRGYALRPAVALPWLTTRGHLTVEAMLPADVLDAVRAIFRLLDGDGALLAAKGLRPVMPDFRLGEQAIEFDEDQHFTIQRLGTLVLYPDAAPLGFDREHYAKLCLETSKRAERALPHRQAAEFPGPASRARQRAYFDAFRDLAAPHFGNGPVLRVGAVGRDAHRALAEFERAVPLH